MSRSFTNYNATYGSLGAVVALLTWMYLSAYAFLFGAELNSEIEHQTAKDSTTGSPEPLGERGAWAADNVATDDTVQDRPEEQREGRRLTQAAPKVADEKGLGRRKQPLSRRRGGAAPPAASRMRGPRSGGCARG